MLEEYSFIQTCTFLPPRINTPKMGGGNYYTCKRWREGIDLMTQLGIEVGVNERHFTTRSISDGKFIPAWERDCFATMNIYSLLLKGMNSYIFPSAHTRG